MTATTKEADKTERAEEIAGEIAQEVDDLARQLRHAETQIAQADKRFSDLDRRRKELAPRAFGGDEKAKVELEGLELEYDEIARSVRVAKDARPELVRMVSEAKARLKDARVNIHKARYASLREERRSLDAERDELAEQLSDVLARQNTLYGQMVAEVRSYNQDEANRMLTSPTARPGNWLRKRFSRLLG